MRNLSRPEQSSITRTGRILARIGSLALGLVLLTPLVGHAQTAPPAPPITVLVRTQTGSPVPGLHLTLRPAPALLGGPATPQAIRETQTNPQGEAGFPPLDGAIWYLTLTGTFAGKPVEDPINQGKPPWGTNPTGNGFPISADPSLEGNPEGDPGAPVLVPILLVDRGDRWLMGLDLGSATGRPLSLPAAILLTPTPVATVTSRPAPTAIISDGAEHITAPTSNALSPTLVIVAGLPLIAVVSLFGGLSLYRRRHPHQPAPAAYLQSTDPTVKENESHA